LLKKEKGKADNCCAIEEQFVWRKQVCQFGFGKERISRVTKKKKQTNKQPAWRSLEVEFLRKGDQLMGTRECSGRWQELG
jgi:hypothetical protein